MKRYKQNLKIDGNRVISYTTHVATIDYSSCIITELGYWSQTTRKHINYVAQELGMSVHYYDATNNPKPDQKPNPTFAVSNINN